MKYNLFIMKVAKVENHHTLKKFKKLSNKKQL